MRMLLDPRNGPDWDLPPPQAEPRTWVVASLPRTGSTLLCRALWDTGRVGAPKEYLNPMQIRDWEVRLGDTLGTRLLHRSIRGPLLSLVGRGPWPPERLERHLARVQARRSAPDGHFGLKLHHHHHEQWFGERPIEQWLGPCRWILLTREDRLAQAISWSRAIRTGRWASTQSALLPPVYSRRHITTLLRRIEAGEAAWEALFAEKGVAPLRLTYEALSEDLPGSLREVLRFLGVRDVDRVRLPPPSLERQADAVNQRWAERYRAGR